MIVYIVCANVLYFASDIPVYVIFNWGRIFHFWRLMRLMIHLMKSSLCTGIS